MNRWLKLIALLVAGWCVMTMTHECGHIVGGWLGGATLRHADIFPWHLPHSLFEPDPHPLLTLWSGPVLGVVVPLGVALLVRREWMWFLANFCLLANGAYLATAWLSGDRFLDTPRLLEAGAWPGSVLAYCILTIVLGYVRFRANLLAVLRLQRAQVHTIPTPAREAP